MREETVNLAIFSEEMKSIGRPAGNQTSSFFPYTRNDGAILEQQTNPRKQLPNGVSLEPLNFPATKSVLWDRTPRGEIETLHLTRKRNARLFVNEKTLRLAQRHISHSNSLVECFLIGSISVDSGEDSSDIIIDRFDPGREVLVNNGSSKMKRKVPTTVVPGDHIVPITLFQGLGGAETFATHTSEEFKKALQVLHSRVSGQEPINLSHIVSLKACCHAHRGDDEIILNIQCGAITMATTIQATPVTPIPVIPTALARNLSGPLRLSEVQGMAKSGYLTMDHTRKLLLLLETDPKAFTLPLVGIWVSGVYSIHHPFIWACCLRYLFSSAIQQRVFASESSFIVLLYTPVKSTPDFWECCPQQENPSSRVFELYSCYENLHLEIPPGPGTSEALCFELFPAPEGMGRSLFQQATDMWEKEHEQEKVSQNGGFLQLNQAATISSSPGEEPSPEPRPTPSPHPQNVQLILPEAEETSLSLSFEESTSAERLQHGFANRQVLRQTQSKIKQAKPQIPQGQRINCDQENGQMKPRQRVASDRSKERIVQNSPSREPLRQIPSPNQMQRSCENQNPVAGKFQKVHPFVAQKMSYQRGVRHQHEVSPSQEKGVRHSTKGRNRNHKAEVARVDQRKQISQNERKTSTDRDHEMNKTRASLNLSKEQETLPKQQKGMDQPQTTTSAYQQPNLDSGYKHPLETVYEGETPDATLVSETGPEFTEENTLPLRPLAKIADNPTGNSPENSVILKISKHGSGIFPHEKQVRCDAFLPKESFEVPHQVAVNQEKKTEERLVVGDEESTELKYNSSSNEHDTRTFQLIQQNAAAAEEQKKSLDSFKMNRLDPYELLIRQEAQLRELQQQIKMLLRQQNTPAHTLNAMLTPPRTPKSDHLLDNHQSPKRAPVSMATACTNTGASLLLLSPVKPKGKKSASTSPMKDTRMPSSTKQCQRSCSVSSSPVTSPLPSNDKNSRASQNQSETVNSDELTNRMIEPDDPSQTLASSLNAVDLPSFHGSPSGVTSPSMLAQAERRGMETSFTSPVLGESASILVQERRTNSESKEDTTADGEEDNEQRKSNHVSLLQRNERQFYDNLLDQVKNLLLTQEGNEKDTATESCQDSLPEKPSTTHEPTREEVVMATVKQLERMKASAIGVSKEITKTPLSVSPNRWLPHRSSSLSVIPHHPHINYVSLSVDDTLDEVFNEADDIALKYLTDDQLQEHWQITGHHKSQSRTRAVTFSAFPDAEKSSLTGRMLFEREHLCNSSSSNGPDYTWNNLSMATKEYLERYCLAPQQHRTPRQKDANIGSSPKNVSEESSGADRGPSSKELSYGCKAPPSTPEPNAKSNGSKILDINRLKKLPKLF